MNQIRMRNDNLLVGNGQLSYQIEVQLLVKLIQCWDTYLQKLVYKSMLIGCVFGEIQM